VAEASRRTGVVSARLAQNLIGVGGAIALWIGLVAAEVLPANLVPGPGAVARELVAVAITAPFWSSTARTLSSWGLALFVGAALALPVGLLVGRFETLYRALRIPLEFLRAVPPIALIPVVVLLYGQSPVAAIILAVYGCIWPLLIQTVYGVRAVDPALRQAAFAYGVSRIGMLVHLYLPATLPYILTGLSISGALALIAIIGSEIIVGIPGVGNQINLARAGGATELAYAYTIWTGLLGIAIAQILAATRRHLLRWQPTAAAAQ
jgi:ABC-type nitrate/sulfonate/bicarbonate transport system permease component